MKKAFFLLLCIAANAMADPGKITGKVTDEASGQGLAGIIVTNGAESIRTDAEGGYELPFHADSRFISVVVPADRDTPIFYQRIREDHGDETYDFNLGSRPALKAFRFVQISDTEGIYTQIFECIRNFSRSYKAAFLLHTGDIHTPEHQKYHAEYFKRENFGTRTYFVLGNHDHKSVGRGEKCFEDTLGPIFYAFEEGNVTFVVLPTYGTYDRKPGFTEEDVNKFFFHIMNLIPKEKPLVIVSHLPENLSADGFVAKDTQYQVDLKQWNVKGWIHGHTHHSRIVRLSCGITLFDCTIATKGGNSGEPAAYRYYHVAEDGTLTSGIIPTRIYRKLSVQVSPQPTDGAWTITAAYADSSSFASGIEVTLTDEQGGSERIALTQSTPLAWSGEYRFKTGVKYTVQAVAKLNSGDSVEQKTVFPSMDSGTRDLELERVICLPAQPLLGSVAFGNGMVFVGTCDNENGINNYVCALDAATGKLRWKYRTAAGIRNSVICGKDVVYAADADSNVYALSAADGGLLWKSAVPLQWPFHLNARAPLLHDGIVYGGMGTCLRALDAETGKVLWTNNAFEATRWSPSISSPIVINGRLIFTQPHSPNPVYALDSKTGEAQWKIPAMRIRIRPTVTPLPNGNLLLVASDFSAILDSATGKVIQTAPSQGDFLKRGTSSMPLIVGDKIYVGTDDRGLAAFNLHNLTRCWDSVEKAGIPKNSLGVTAAYHGNSRCVDTSPVKMNDNLLFAGLDGNLYECAMENGAQTGRIEIGMPVIATPGIADGRLYLLDYAGRMFIFRIKSQSR